MLLQRRSSVFWISTGIRFPCSSCDQLFADEKTLQIYNKSKHNDRSKKNRFVCTECDYSSNHKSNFMYHCVTHTAVKADKCVTFGNCITEKSSLTLHIKSALYKESYYECEVGDKGFSYYSSLFHHFKASRYKIK